MASGRLLWERLRKWISRVARFFLRPRFLRSLDLLVGSHRSTFYVRVVVRPQFLRSFDDQAWRHPFLSAANIAAFRAYSEQVWQFARDHAARFDRPLDCAFAVNMAQNMNKWAAMSARGGATATLYTHPMDVHPFSHPGWEHFDGTLDEWNALGEEARRRVYVSASQVPWHVVPIDASAFRQTTLYFDHRVKYGMERRDLFTLLAEAPSVRYEVLQYNPTLAGYFDWAVALAQHEVCYAASSPFAAYASGVPYCAFSVGGDLQSDCGQSTDLGRSMALAFGSAHFLMVSNPHTLGHSRRLGFVNGVYMPYPMDSDRYSPGHGVLRNEWVARCGDGVFVLVSTRIDSRVKGYGPEMLQQLLALVQREPRLRLVFLAWGADADSYRSTVAAAGLSDRVLILPPVGKERLIDYYRSSDVVLDQFVYGYYGSAALEAASIGKPVIMFIRRDHYDPLYRGDSAPVLDARSPSEVVAHLAELAGDPERRRALGESMRRWLVDHHGESRTTPILLALLRLAASRQPLPRDLVSPLLAPTTEEEDAYHASCLKVAAGS